MAADSMKIFDEFMSHIKQVEKQDSVYTSKQQIDRLLRPGSSYANLNPFDVLLLDFDCTHEQIKKQYKKISILIHPDKNPDDIERARKAFDVVNKAYKTLDDEQTRGEAMLVVEEARHRIRQTIEEKKKRLRREQQQQGSNNRSASKQAPPAIALIELDEERPEKFNEAVRVLTMKLFADYERKRRSEMDRLANEKKRKREEEIEAEEKKREQQEWTKNYEETREQRINSWKSFQNNKGTKKVKGEFRPPKTKAESR